MGFTVDIKGNASHLDKTIKNVKTSLSAIGSVATTAATSLAAIGVAGGAALTAFIVSSSKAAADVEDLGIQFEVLTGSAKTAADLMKTFREEEEKSALNLSDYATAAKTMLAFGASVDGIMPALRMIGDISMGNSERFGSLALAFAQTTAAGRLMGQEVLQFVNAGFNPLEQIARDTGRSMQDLKKDMEDGAITVDMVKQAFISATSEGGRFYKAIEKGSDTTNAKINKLGAAVTQLQVAFGTGFNEGLKDALDATNTFLPQLQDKFSTAGSMLGGAITEAIAGNTEQLAAVGALLGQIVFEGFKSFYMKSMDELLAGVQNIGSTESDAMKNMVNNVSNRLGRGDVYKNGEIGSKTTAAPLSSYMQNAIENVQGGGSLNTLQKAEDKRDLAEALKKGILDSNMTKSVREGVLEAWKTQGGAKFSN